MIYFPGLAINIHPNIMKIKRVAHHINDTTRHFHGVFKNETEAS